MPLYLGHFHCVQNSAAGSPLLSCPIDQGYDSKVRATGVSLRKKKTLKIAKTIQIKKKMSRYKTAGRMAKIKRLTIPSIDEDVKQHCQ